MISNLLIMVKDSFLSSLNSLIFTFLKEISMFSQLKCIKYLINGGISERRSKSAATLSANSKKNVKISIRKMSILSSQLMMEKTILISLYLLMIYSCLELNSMMLKNLATLPFSKIRAPLMTEFPPIHGSLETFS